MSHGKTAWAVASDDVHDYFDFDDRLAPTPGRAWIVVQAPGLTVDAIMDAIRKGHFYASTGVVLKEYHSDSKRISMAIDPPFAWSAVAEVAGLSPRYQFIGDEGYVRASIIDSDGRRAWTQPVFLDGRSQSVQ